MSNRIEEIKERLAKSKPSCWVQTDIQFLLDEVGKLTKEVKEAYANGYDEGNDGGCRENDKD